jgi:hypothetical protein
MSPRKLNSDDSAPIPSFDYPIHADSVFLQAIIEEFRIYLRTYSLHESLFKGIMLDCHRKINYDGRIIALPHL